MDPSIIHYRAFRNNWSLQMIPGCNVPEEASDTAYEGEYNVNVPCGHHGKEHQYIAGLGEQTHIRLIPVWELLERGR